jgi:hypothetical protein
MVQLINKVAHETSKFKDGAIKFMNPCLGTILNSVHSWSFFRELVYARRVTEKATISLQRAHVQKNEDDVAT